MSFSRFAMVWFSIILVLGILTAHRFPLSFPVWKLIIPLFLLSVILWYRARNLLLQDISFGLVACLCFYLLGILVYQAQEPRFQPRHYSHKHTEGMELISVKILKEFKPDKYNSKWLAAVTAMDGKNRNGKILLSISLESLKIPLRPDEELIIAGSISPIPPPLNPGIFDYAAYMKSLGVHGQMRISEKDILLRQKGSPTIFGKAQKLRQKMIEKLREQNLTPDERSIIQALILGEKKDIDKQVYQEYAAAGAVHILAVSGLHVGILYLFFAFLLKPINRIKYGKAIQALILLLLLWGFALLSGLSPSVTRAVTMFSFFALAGMVGRRTNSFHTLFLSLFALLVINPLLLFQVGFQLSYLAVFFIIWLQPILYKIGYSRFWLPRKIWAIVSVTICAQLGVLPLSLYYFHQFPGLFLITNIVVLPCLAIIMVGGILILLLAMVNLLPSWLGQGYNSVIEYLNSFIHWVALQDQFLFREIPFSALKVVVSYLLILFLIGFMRSPNFKKTMLVLSAVVVVISVFIFEKAQNSRPEFWILHRNRETLLARKHRQQLTLYSAQYPKEKASAYLVNSFMMEKSIETYSEAKLPRVFAYNDKVILVLDSMGIFPKRETAGETSIELLLLTQSPRVNLSRLIDSISPRMVIADGSNYPSFVTRWEKTCKRKKLPFHATGRKGAYNIE